MLKLGKCAFYFFLSFFSFLNLTLAEQSSPDKRISVTPSVARIDLALEKPETEFIYKNTTETVVELKLSAQNFTELEDGTKVRFLDEKETTKYELASWIDFDNKTVLLNPGEQKTVKVFIADKKLSPGGHYASIQAEIKQIVENKQVSVRGILSNLLFVRANTGNETENALVESFSSQSTWFAVPKMYNIRFKNTGNVEEIPYGAIQLMDPAGKEVGKGILNEDSLLVLPESSRNFAVPVRFTTKALLPGFYSIELNIHYGKSNKTLNRRQKVFYLGNLVLLSLLLLPVVAISIIIFVFIRKRMRGKRKKKNYFSIQSVT